MTEEKTKQISENLQNEIRQRNLDEQADFIFVDKILEISEDIVEVWFETPFHGEESSRRFSKPGASVAGIPNLRNLYKQTHAHMLNPESIFGVSIPRDNEFVEDIEFSDSRESWVPEESLEAEPKERTIRHWIDGGLASLLGVGTLALSTIVGGMLPLIYGLIVLTVMLFTASEILKPRYLVPENASMIHYDSQISEGSVIILKKRNRLRRSKREAYRVIEKVDSGYEVMSQNGKNGVLSYDAESSTWSVKYFTGYSEDIMGEFELAYLLNHNSRLDAGGKAEVNSRISSQLRDDIRDRMLSSESDVLYVDRIEEKSGREVMVYFTEPFHNEEYSKSFIKPGISYDKVEDLEELYQATASDMSNPESVIGKKIDKGSDLISEEINPNYNPSESIDPFKMSETSVSREIASGAILILSLVSSIGLLSLLNPDVTSLALSISVFALGYTASFNLHSKRIPEIDDSYEIDYPSEVSKGDTIILDERLDGSPEILNGSLRGFEEREICKSISSDENRIIMRDGQEATLGKKSFFDPHTRERDQSWVIRKIRDETAVDVVGEYNRAFVIGGDISD